MTTQQPPTAGTTRFKTLAIRTASGAALLAIVLPAIWFRGPLLMLVVLVAAVVAAHEVYTMARKAGYSPWYPAGLALSLLLALRAYVGGNLSFSAGSPDTGAMVMSLSLVLLLALARQGYVWLRARAETTRPRGQQSESAVRAGTAWADLGLTLAGALYTGGLLGFIPALADMPAGNGAPDGRAWLLMILLGTAAGDTGAYLVGSAVGRHKLIPHISPGKTWEGLAGGLIASVAAAVALAGLLDLGVWQAVALGLLIAVAAIAGDLSESLIKRATGQKDSGNLIPGHGGVLDRLDSVLFVTLAVYWFVQLSGGAS